VDRWGFVRSDSRNSGADVLRPSPTSARGAPVAPPRLILRPNPGSGPIEVAWRGLAPGPGVVEIYDLRGRRVRRLPIVDVAARSGTAWDGRDATGRPAAAGSYLLAAIFWRSATRAVFSRGASF
jgi:hypothetical protein